MTEQNQALSEDKYPRNHPFRFFTSAIPEKAKALLTSHYAWLFYSFLSGLLASLSMSPYSLWPLLVLGLSLLYVLLTNAHNKSVAFGVGWLFGFGYFLLSLSWIGNALLVENNQYRWAYPLALCGLPALFAFYPAIAALILHRADLKKLTGFTFFIGVFGLFEWIRSVFLTGFPWNLYAFTWSQTPEMLQFVSVFGIYGLSLLTIAGCALPAFIAINIDKPARVWLTGFVIACSFLGSFIYGYQRLDTNQTEFKEDTRIVLVQPNIPQSEKWVKEKLFQNFAKHLDITKNAGRNLSLTMADKAENTYIIWPESAISPLIFERLEKPTLLKRTIGSFGDNSFLISGVLRRDVEPIRDDLTQKNNDNSETPEPLPRQFQPAVNYVYFNSLITMNGNDEIPVVYDKHHLVPFGEYIPLSSIFDIAPIVGFSGFQRGVRPKPITPLNTAPAFTPLICYEAIFPSLTMNARAQGAKWIVNITNDAWYGDSGGPYQHLAQTKIRAIEQGIPLVRSAGTGISAIIDSYGRILEQIPYNTDGYRTIYLPSPTSNAPFYTKWGDIPFLVVLFLLLTPGCLISSQKDELA